MQPGKRKGWVLLWSSLLLPGLSAAQPAQPAQLPAPDPVPPPTEAELRERTRHWLKKLKLSGTTEETDRARRNLIALGKPAVPLIVELAQKDFGDKPQPFHMWNVCLVLGRMSDDRAMPYLMKWLEPVPEADLRQRPEWQYVRAFAALALGKVPDPGRAAVPAMRKLVADDREHPFVRRCAALALGQLQDEGAVKVLGDQLADNRQISVQRVAAAMALGMIRAEGSGTRLLEYLELEPGRRDALADRMAVHGLGLHKREKAVEPLRKLLAATTDDNLRGAIVLVLAWLGNRDAAPDVRKIMDHEQLPAFTRCNAALALANLGEPDAAAALLRRMARYDGRTQMLGTAAYASVALGEVSGDENIVTLCEIVRDTDYSVLALNAVNALGHRRDPRTAPFLLEQYGRFDGVRGLFIRGEIVRALMAFPTQEAIRTFCLKALKDPSDYVQAKAAIALARYPGADTENALLEAVSDQSPEVRGEAALSLGILKSAKAADELRARMRDDFDWVRIRARRALENIVKFGKDEFQQAPGLQDLIDLRVKAVGANLEEELNRLYQDGYQRVLELDGRRW